jgi:hypothetical protein
MISALRMKSVRIAPLILSFSSLGGGQRLGQLGMVLFVFFLAVQELVRELLDTLVAEKQTADDQQRRHQPRHKGADQQRRRHQDGLVHHRTLGHRPHHRQLAVGAHAGDLLGVERQIVAQHTGRLLGGHFGEHRHVVEDGGNVIQQGKQATSGHGGVLLWLGPEA